MSNLREWSLGDDAVDSSKDSEGPVEGRASMSNLRPRWERQRHECTQRYEAFFIADCPLDFSDELDFKRTVNVFMWNDDTEHEAWGFKASSSYFREPHEGKESG